jgi:DNA mismatch endonuclease (patch repair protein)
VARVEAIRRPRIATRRIVTKARRDPLSKTERSERMSRVRNKHSEIELLVRRTTFALGYRFRLHAKDLPGKPDLVFRGRRKVIFVHSCFWHQHDCHKYKNPASNIDFWATKLRKNVERDRAVSLQMSKLGWKSLVIWECQLRNELALARRISRFLQR